MIPTAFTRYDLIFDQNNNWFEKKESDIVKNDKKDAKRNSKNRDAYQQSFLISLLSQKGYEIALERLYKRGQVTKQMVTIESIKKDEKIIFNQKMIPQHFNNLKERRQYLDSLTNNLMIDLLNSEHIFVQVRKTRRVLKENSLLMKRIHSVQCNNQIIDQQKMVEIGKKCNEIIVSQISTKKGFIVHSYDFLFKNIFNEKNILPFSNSSSLSFIAHSE